MKKFETPELEVVKFEAMDVITTSGDDWIDGAEEGDNTTNWN